MSATNAIGNHRTGKCACCCDQFAKATESGTDNERWGRLIFVVFSKSGKPHCTTGSGDLAKLVYCPWCGAELATAIKAMKDTSNA